MSTTARPGGHGHRPDRLLPGHDPAGAATAVRGSGQGFCCDFGRGMGALFPALVGHLSQTMPLADAMALFAASAYGLFFLAALALPETRGRVLTADV